MSYLLDTSVLTRLHSTEVRLRIEELDGSGLARTALTDLEIGFSARNGAEWDRLTTATAAFRLVEIETSHFDRARQVQRLLAEAGRRGRKVPDLLIAAVGEAASLTVLHYDTDFDQIGAVTGQPVEWVVRRRTID